MISNVLVETTGSFWLSCSPTLGRALSLNSCVSVLCSPPRSRRFEGRPFCLSLQEIYHSEEAGREVGILLGERSRSGPCRRPERPYRGGVHRPPAKRRPGRAPLPLAVWFFRACETRRATPRPQKTTENRCGVVESQRLTYVHASRIAHVLSSVELSCILSVSFLP